MIKKSSKAVVCFSLLVVGLFFATPSSRRPPLDPSLAAQLSRAEERGTEEPKPALELKSEGGEVCSGTPDHAKATDETSPVIPDIPLEKPVFEKDRRQAVLSLIHFPWEDLGYNIVFLGSRMGYRAMTLTARHRIEVYVRPGEGLMHQAFDLAHELGHAFDLKYNDEERRRKWCELRGINPSKPWFGCDACPDYSTPAGDFAETFAYLLLGPGNYHSLIAPQPKADQVAELAAFCHIDQVSDILLARIKKPASPAVQSAKTEAKEHKPAPTQPAREESVVNPAPTEEIPAEVAKPAEEQPMQPQNAPTDAQATKEAPKEETPAPSPQPDAVQIPQPAPVPTI